MLSHTITATEAARKFQEAPQEGDIDLIAEVGAILTANGLSRSIFESNPDIIAAVGKRPDIQRFYLNKYWSLQLMSTGPAIEERYSLTPNGDIKDWLRLFVHNVVPYLIKHNLPKVI